jgi:hypothetical protein
LVFPNDLKRTILLMVYADDVLSTLSKRLDVGHRQLGRAARIDPALIDPLWVDLKNRRSKARDPVLHRVLGSVSKRDHGNHRGDADHDPEHREE